MGIWTRDLRAFFVDERATETVEWGIVSGFIIVGLVLTLASIGSWVQGAFTQMQTEIGA